MVASAPGEKLLVGRRIEPAVRYQACFCAENYTFSRENKQLLPPELHFLTPVCTKSSVGWGFAPDPTGGAYNASPYPLA